MAASAAMGFAAPPPAFAARPAISLVDQRGTVFPFQSLRGAPVILTFVSAHCTDACPIVEAEIARCAALYKGSPAALHFLTVTLNPERDRPSDMRKVAHSFDARPPRWIFATGTKADVHRLMRMFGVRARLDSHALANAHTTFVYVLDPDLRLRQTLPVSDSLPQQIQADVRP